VEGKSGIQFVELRFGREGVLLHEICRGGRERVGYTVYSIILHVERLGRLKRDGCISAMEIQGPS
jgi:hypothetical protein